MPSWPSVATTPRAAINSTITTTSMISMVTSDRYTISSITAMTANVIAVTWWVPALPTSKLSVISGAAPVT